MLCRYITCGVAGHEEEPDKTMSSVSCCGCDVVYVLNMYIPRVSGQPDGLTNNGYFPALGCGREEYQVEWSNHHSLWSFKMATLKTEIERRLLRYLDMEEDISLLTYSTTEVPGEICILGTREHPVAPACLHA